jgi:hypothetical protein
MVGNGMMGGWVAGGCVGGMDVGGTDVLGGLKRVGVGAKRVGCRVGGAEVRTFVGSPGSLVRGVAVLMKVDVGEGVRVAEGVAVGMVEVMVGISDGVCVGTVDVGNGPISAPEVSARAVLVLLAL